MERKTGFCIAGQFATGDRLGHVAETIVRLDLGFVLPPLVSAAIAR